MNQDAKRRLREFGIAPPQGTSCEHPEHKGAVRCPRCDSEQTEKLVNLVPLHARHCIDALNA